MNFLLRLLPLSLGGALCYFVALRVASASRPTKFIAVALAVVCAGYAFTWFNVHLARRNGDLLQPLPTARKVLGWLMMVAGALVAGFGFSVNSRLGVLAAVVCLWMADDRLTPSTKSVRRQLPKQPGALTPEEQGLLDTALRDRKKHAAAGVFWGSKVVLRRLLETMPENQAAHLESVLCALGALAGYACQASLREHARNKGLDETALLVAADTDGGTYFFGDFLNDVLAESKSSVWNLAAKAARDAGCHDLPDAAEIFSHVAGTVGHQDFGIPRVPARHAAKAAPLQFLRTYWPVLGPLARKFCATPGELPVLFAMSIQDAMALGKSRLPPRTAFLIAMESAIPMSKIDLKEGGSAR